MTIITSLAPLHVEMHSKHREEECLEAYWLLALNSQCALFTVYTHCKESAFAIPYIASYMNAAWVKHIKQCELINIFKLSKILLPSLVALPWSNKPQPNSYWHKGTCSLSLDFCLIFSRSHVVRYKNYRCFKMSLVNYACELIRLFNVHVN